MDKNDEANAVIEGMKADFAEVAELATGDGTETVYFEVFPWNMDCGLQAMVLL